MVPESLDTFIQIAKRCQAFLGGIGISMMCVQRGENALYCNRVRRISRNRKNRDVAVLLS